MFGIFLLRQG